MFYVIHPDGWAEIVGWLLARLRSLMNESDTCALVSRLHLCTKNCNRGTAIILRTPMDEKKGMLLCACIPFLFVAPTRIELVFHA